MLTHWYEYLPAAWFTPEGRWCKEEREPRGTPAGISDLVIECCY